MSSAIPNEQPELDLGYRIALIGQSPGQDEKLMGRPMVGHSGDLLFRLASQCGIMRSASFVGNVCQHVGHWGFETWQMESSLRQLKVDLDKANPNICVLLGADALRAAGVVIRTKPRGPGVSVDEYRGTLFKCTDLESPFYGRKCIGTYNPAAVLRRYEQYPLVMFDLRRARAEAESPELTLPTRKLQIDLPADEIIRYLHSIGPQHYLSVDIEGGVVDGISMVGFSTRPNHAVVVALADHSPADQIRLIREMGKVLTNPEIPKILQNGLYDSYVLSRLWGCRISNIYWDTMVAGSTLYPELPKGLGTLASICTKEPFYKADIKSGNWDVFKRYNAKDAAVTQEIFQVQRKEFHNSTQERHLRNKIDMLNPVLYMELRGFNYDKEAADQWFNEVRIEQLQIKSRFDIEANRLNPAVTNINPNTSQGKNALATILYDKLGFEPQFKIEKGRKTSKKVADKGALLKLFKLYPRNPIIYDILLWRKREGLRKQLACDIDEDGRIRASMNVVGAATHRWSCSKPPQNNGINQQTAMRDVRKLYLADPGNYVYQVDLGGADGWTVAAHCARLGDPTMLDDYLAGIKPAQVLVCMLIHGASVADLSQSDLLKLIEETKYELSKTGQWTWRYHTSKRAQHASNYFTGVRKMASVIVEDSWKWSDNPIYIKEKDCRILQDLYLKHRYRGVKVWHEWLESELKRHGTLTSASGWTRTFFGRRNDRSTLQKYAAHEPQQNTAFATELALSNLWNDPDNRRADGTLIIEPMLQVHDALVGQFPVERADECVAKLQQYFNNTLRIAGQDIVIPYDGGYGLDWQQAGGDGGKDRPPIGLI